MNTTLVYFVEDKLHTNEAPQLTLESAILKVLGKLVTEHAEKYNLIL